MHSQQQKPSPQRVVSIEEKLLQRIDHVEAHVSSVEIMLFQVQQNMEVCAQKLQYLIDLIDRQKEVKGD